VEEYDLWARLLLDGKQFLNVQKPNFLYQLNKQTVFIRRRIRPNHRENWSIGRIIAAPQPPVAYI
jgi:hypothetical protein